MGREGGRDNLVSLCGKGYRHKRRREEETNWLRGGERRGWMESVDKVKVGQRKKRQNNKKWQKVFIQYLGIVHTTTVLQYQYK